MTGKWPRVPVSHVATAVIGGTPSRSVAEYWHGDIPWVTAKDVASVSARYLDRVQEFITEGGLKDSAAKLLPKGTVLITARGTVGALAQLGREMAFNQTCYALVPRDDLDKDFLFYALKGTMAEMLALTYGTVFETITTQTFDHWLIPLPPLPEQRAIAHILGTLDDKIELNRRMSETLEAMARATVGIAMGAAGSDAALETADIVLMSDELRRIPYVVQLGRRTLDTIKANIALSLVIKGLFLLLAVTGLATLWMAVFADMGTSLIVTFNGMRLLREK